MTMTIFRNSCPPFAPVARGVGIVEAVVLTVMCDGVACDGVARNGLARNRLVRGGGAECNKVAAGGAVGKAASFIPAMTELPASNMPSSVIGPFAVIVSRKGFSLMTILT